jgi:SAM-dependent methyltransferase
MAPHRAILRAVECRFMGSVPLVAPILDIGCGDGHFASIAYDTPIDVGIDLNEHELAEAAARPGVYRRTLRADATALPFEDGAFNTVVSNCVLEHIPDIDTALREIARVLAPGGTFATTLPSEHYPHYLLGSTLLRGLRLLGLAAAYGAFFNRISHHHHVYSPNEWRRRFDAVGLSVQEQRYYFSPAAHRAFDPSHYLGAPNLLARKLTGRWVLHPRQAAPYRWWLRRYYDEPLPERGAYQFVRCVKQIGSAQDAHLS